MRIGSVSALFLVSTIAFVVGCEGSDSDALPVDAADSGDDLAVPDTALGDTAAEDSGATENDSANEVEAEDTAGDSTIDTADIADTAVTLDAADTTADTDTADTAAADTLDTLDTPSACVPTTEICNNTDDDCDGLVDEGLTRACGSSVGECRPGVQQCTAGTYGGMCVGSVGPTTEVCDGRDNNCNGVIDEGLTQTCYGGPPATAGVGICRAGTQACSMGAFGSCLGEVLPAAETCDGSDQNCDGVVDDGCPASVAFTFAALTPAHGSSGGTLYADRCAAGYAISAIKVTLGSYVQRVQVTCASIAVTESRSATPYSYSLTVGTTATLPERGLLAGTVATAECPANTFAYALSGRAGLVVDGIQLHCASLALTGSAPGSFSITRTIAASSSYVGGGGGLAFGPDACATDQVAMGIDVRAADGVDNIRLACGAPTVVPK